MDSKNILLTNIRLKILIFFIINYVKTPLNGVTAFFNIITFTNS